MTKAKQKQKGDKVTKQELKDLRDQLARALADYDNLRKRVERENKAIQRIVSAKIVSRMLPVYDMLVDAQKHLKDPGIAMVVEEFEKTLKDEEVEKIQVKEGSKFDENIHEAVDIMEGGKKGRVAEIVLTGWKFVEGDVIRPAKVKVYK